MHPTNAKDLVRRALLSGCTTVEECAEWIVENEEVEGDEEEEEEGTSPEQTNNTTTTDTSSLSASHADNTVPTSSAASASSTTAAASVEEEEDGESEFTEVLPKVDEKLLETILGFGFPEVIPQ
jgi:phosphatidate phosphatase PAH1